MYPSLPHENVSLIIVQDTLKSKCAGTSACAFLKYMVTVHSVTSNSSVCNAECTHFAKIMQNGAVKLRFLTKKLSKILEFDVGMKSNRYMSLQFIK